MTNRNMPSRAKDQPSGTDTDKESGNAVRAGGSAMSRMRRGWTSSGRALFLLGVAVAYLLFEEITEIFYPEAVVRLWHWLGVIAISLLGASLARLVWRLSVRERELAVRLVDERAARQSVEQDLASNRAARVALFEALPDLFFKLELDGSIVDYQTRQADDLYADPANFLGKRMQDVLPETVARRFDRALGRLAAGAKIDVFEYTLLMPDGEHPYEARMVPLGEKHVAAVVREISDRRRAERDPERYRENLEELVRERTRELEASRARLGETERLASVGTLAAGIAHQLNNPVGSILAAAQFAERYQDAPDAAQLARDSLATVIREAVRCGQIVKELLKLSRGQPTLRKGVEPHALVHHCMNMCAPYAREHGVTIEAAQIAREAMIFGSPLEIEEALVNLLRNGIEASGLGGRVGVAVDVNAGWVRIGVFDTGPGMSPEISSRALDPFYTTRLIEGGTGLGLSVVHRVVEAHGGHLHFENRPEGGSVVRMDLPAQTEAPL